MVVAVALALEALVSALAVAVARRSDDRPYAALVVWVTATDAARYVVMATPATSSPWWFFSVDALWLSWFVAHVAAARAYRGRSVRPIVVGGLAALGPLVWIEHRYVSTWRAALGLWRSPRGYTLTGAGLLSSAWAFVLLFRDGTRATVGSRLALVSAGFSVAQVIALRLGLPHYRVGVFVYLGIAAIVLARALVGQRSGAALARSSSRSSTSVETIS